MDFIRYVLVEGTAEQSLNLKLLILAATLLFALMVTSPKRRWWVRLLIGLLCSIGTFALFYYTYPYVDPFAAAYGALISTALGRTALGILVILFGLGAHLLRNINKVLYGQLEIVFAGLSAIWIASQLKPGQSLFSQWVALIGAAYVVSRGLNNWAEGLVAEPDKYGNRTIKGYLMSRLIDTKDAPSPLALLRKQ